MEDQRLLARFIEEGSQPAFTQLVERHRDFVYSTCRRELGDCGLAEDAAQVVFLILARKARSLRHEVVLSGWLFQTARFTAKDLLKRERRRGMRDDRIGAEMLGLAEQEQDAAWREISPWLHESLGRLNEKDRLAVLLRFFEDRSFAEIALVLGQKEDAARHRVNRALEKMRRTLSSRGVAVPAAALAGLLAANAVKPAPVFASVMRDLRAIRRSHFRRLPPSASHQRSITSHVNETEPRHGGRRHPHLCCAGCWRGAGEEHASRSGYAHIACPLPGWCQPEQENPRHLDELCSRPSETDTGPPVQPGRHFPAKPERGRGRLSAPAISP